jgi:hypothetical protein
MSSIAKKIKSIVTHGLEPFEIGRQNYLLNDSIIEAKALRRYNLSKHCLVKEPIDFLRIEDKRIIGLSNMMVDKCGCSATYFFRQDIEKLKEWNE